MLKREADSLDPEDLTKKLRISGGGEQECESFKLVSGVNAVITPKIKILLEQMRAYSHCALPILVQSFGVGSGKSLLIEVFCANVVRTVVNVGEENEVKGVIGAYSTDPSNPGGFKWTDGVLVDAMRKGHVLVLEDLHLANDEYCAMIKSVIEDRRVHLNDGKVLRAAESFRILASATLDGQGGGSAFKATLAPLFMPILLEKPDLHEQSLILTKRFPEIRALIPLLSEMYKILCETKEKEPFFNLRKLCQLCERLQFLGIACGTKDEGAALNLMARQAILVEFSDCFLSHLQYEERVGMATKFLPILCLGAQDLGEFVAERAPKLQATAQSLVIGRVAFDNPQSARGNQESMKIANTRLSLQVMEKVAVAVKLNEPVLLVGETGTGKTTIIQSLCKAIGSNRLIVVNLSQQTETSDLLGGFRPVPLTFSAKQLVNEFQECFAAHFSITKNAIYIQQILKAFEGKDYARIVSLVRGVLGKLKEMTADWQAVAKSLLAFKAQLELGQEHPFFAFVEGALIKAIENGHWILLDEINLASPETLQIIGGLLQSSQASIRLVDRGDNRPIKRHPDFRLFAAMNPATDAGKKSLPPGITNKFTEIYVDETDVFKEDLRMIISHTLATRNACDAIFRQSILELYYEWKEAISNHSMVDGSQKTPLLNLRTLVRALSFARRTAVLWGVKRAVWEGFCMTFVTVLDGQSAEIAMGILKMKLGIDPTPLNNPRIEAIKEYSTHANLNGDAYKILDGYILPLGNDSEALSLEELADRFILTPSVRTNVANLARAMMSCSASGGDPILLEGPTSAGKTSVIQFLAQYTGHRFVRINNHEQTDIQEYIGAFQPSGNGSLCFREGLLVQALRHGWWLVLDELNLAPSEVLEALNRLLDDNRELYIPEIGQTVRPHPSFRLFATQNPAGLYGGRKVLSKAFRSRFIELQFADLPVGEVEAILCARCKIAPSHACKISKVYALLMERRSGSNLFAGRHSLVTLRDLFKWAGRPMVTIEDLALNGFFVLAERLRNGQEKVWVRSIIEEALRCKIDADRAYASFNVGRSEGNAQRIVWTKQMKRLAFLVQAALDAKEPVLLVGETGCGKTSVCQVLANSGGGGGGEGEGGESSAPLIAINCHQNTETSDFLGSLRPNRHSTEHSPTDKAKGDGPNAEARELFVWQDGPLVAAMKRGSFLLIDEISLADDSVLERLNSLLEPERAVTLAECAEGQHLVAHEQFALVATMNPGGDFGKKELSPALRNRFTEIWVPSIGGDLDDLRMIAAEYVEDPAVVDGMISFLAWWQNNAMDPNLTTAMSAKPKIMPNIANVTFSIRSLISWCRFVERLGTDAFYVKSAAESIFLDPLSSSVAGCADANLDAFVAVCRERLDEIFNASLGLSQIEHAAAPLASLDEIGKFYHNDGGYDSFGIIPFTLPLNRTVVDVENAHFSSAFCFHSPTVKASLFRILRACQLGSACLLEGSPGVGKTSLIQALAKHTGNRLTRINLSDQTDLMDLFGGDVPQAGGFGWVDGPFLAALKRGDWILLDELNLANQSVLEGLNACLDHRGTIYIPEIDATFTCAPGTRIFAAQNPMGEGGGRKGLPKSFLNRFVQVWIDALRGEDMEAILADAFSRSKKTTFTELPASSIGASLISQAVHFNERINRLVNQRREFGVEGSPWEFNLRDLFKWLRLQQRFPKASPAQLFTLIYARRMRTLADQQRMIDEINEHFAGYDPVQPTLWTASKENTFCVGLVEKSLDYGTGNLSIDLDLLPGQLCALESILICIDQGWLAILYDGNHHRVQDDLNPHSLKNNNFATKIIHNNAGRGKTSLIRLAAKICGVHCIESINLSSMSDTSDLLGSFEQVSAAEVLEEAGSMAGRSFLDKSELKAFIDDMRVVTESDDCMMARLKELQSKLECSLAFEWKDGPLIKALLHGSWLILEDADKCPPSILDRLNSLFESDAQGAPSSITITESGEFRRIEACKGFRIFFTCSGVGQLSRAMRNRGVEICIVNAGSVANRVGLLDGDADENVSMNHTLEAKNRTSNNTTLSSAMDALAVYKAFPNSNKHFDEHIMEMICGDKNDHWRYLSMLGRLATDENNGIIKIIDDTVHADDDYSIFEIVKFWSTIPTGSFGRVQAYDYLNALMNQVFSRLSPRLPEALESIFVDQCLWIDGQTLLNSGLMVIDSDGILEKNGLSHEIVPLKCLLKTRNEAWEAYWFEYCRKKFVRNNTNVSKGKLDPLDARKLSHLMGGADLHLFAKCNTLMGLLRSSFDGEDSLEMLAQTCLNSNRSHEYPLFITKLCSSLKRSAFICNQTLEFEMGADGERPSLDLLGVVVKECMGQYYQWCSSLSISKVMEIRNCHALLQSNIVSLPGIARTLSAAIQKMQLVQSLESKKILQLWSAQACLSRPSGDSDQSSLLQMMLRQLVALLQLWSIEDPFVDWLPGREQQLKEIKSLNGTIKHTRQLLLAKLFGVDATDLLTGGDLDGKDVVISAISAIKDRLSSGCDDGMRTKFITRQCQLLDLLSRALLDNHSNTLRHQQKELLASNLFSLHQRLEEAKSTGADKDDFIGMLASILEVCFVALDWDAVLVNDQDEQVSCLISEHLRLSEREEACSYDSMQSIYHSLLHAHLINHLAHNHGSNNINSNNDDYGEQMVTGIIKYLYYNQGSSEESSTAFSHKGLDEDGMVEEYVKRHFESINSSAASSEFGNVGNLIVKHLISTCSNESLFQAGDGSAVWNEWIKWMTANWIGNQESMADYRLLLSYNQEMISNSLESDKDPMISVDEKGESEEHIDHTDNQFLLLSHSKGKGPFNVYRAPTDPSLLKPLFKTLCGLQTDCQGLLSSHPQYAEHDHLLSLGQQITRLLSLPLSTTPLISIINALELISGKLAQWRQVANREHALQGRQDEITSILIGWRRKELAGWRDALEVVEAELVGGEMEEKFIWLAHLCAQCFGDDGDSDNIGADDTAAGNPKTTNKDLIRLIDEFMLAGTSLAQFTARYTLISLAQRLPSTLPENAKILQTLLAYHTPMYSSIRTHLHTKKRELKRDLRAALLAVHWSPTAYASQAQACSQLQRMVAKCCVRWRVVLGESVVGGLLAGGNSALGSWNHASGNNQRGSVDHDPSNVMLKCFYNFDFVLASKRDQKKNTSLAGKEEIAAVAAKRLARLLDTINAKDASDPATLLASMPSSLIASLQASRSAKSVQVKQKFLVEMFRGLKEQLGVALHRSIKGDADWSIVDCLSKISQTCSQAHASYGECKGCLHEFTSTLSQMHTIIPTPTKPPHEDIAVRTVQVSASVLVDLAGWCLSVGGVVDVFSSGLGAVDNVLASLQSRDLCLQLREGGNQGEYSQQIVMFNVEAVKAVLLRALGSLAYAERLLAPHLLDHSNNHNQYESNSEIVSIGKGGDALLDIKNQLTKFIGMIKECLDLLLDPQIISLSAYNQIINCLKNDITLLNDLGDDGLYDIKDIVTFVNRNCLSPLRNNALEILLNDSRHFDDVFNDENIIARQKEATLLLQLHIQDIERIFSASHTNHGDCSLAHLMQKISVWSEAINALLARDMIGSLSINHARSKTGNNTHATPLIPTHTIVDLLSHIRSFHVQLHAYIHDCRANMLSLLKSVFLIITHYYEHGWERPQSEDKDGSRKEREEETSNGQGMSNCDDSMQDDKDVKNVSNEIEFEEQITDLLNDQRDPDGDNKDKVKKEEEEDESIEMDADFDAGLEDCRDGENGQEDEQNDNEKNMDNQMGETLGDAPLQQLDDGWDNEEEISDDHKSEDDDKEANEEEKEQNDQDKNDLSNAQHLDADKDFNKELDDEIDTENGIDEASQQKESELVANEKEEEEQGKAAAGSQEAEDDLDGGRDGDEDGDSVDNDEMDVDLEEDNGQDCENDKEMEGDDSEEEGINEMDVDDESDNENVGGGEEEAKDVSSDPEQEGVDDQDDGDGSQPAPLQAKQYKNDNASTEHNKDNKEEGAEEDKDFNGAGAEAAMELDSRGSEIQTRSQSENNTQQPPQPERDAQNKIHQNIKKQQSSIDRMIELIKNTIKSRSKDASRGEDGGDHGIDEEEEENSEAEDGKMAKGIADASDEQGKQENQTVQEEFADEEATMLASTEEDESEADEAEEQNSLKQSTLKPTPQHHQAHDNQEPVPQHEEEEPLPTWPQLKAATLAATSTLTEQLRLVLHPTHAARLSGQHRSGKRLNLRKIPAYVASSYRRDKIWLRRGGLSKREWKVTISVDDSGSMRGDGVHLQACKAMVMICEALDVLGVGGVEIVKFGGSVQSLTLEDCRHPQKAASEPDQLPLDQNSTFIDNNPGIGFTFKDTETHLESLLAHINKSHPLGKTSNWALNLILSDGIVPTQDHQQIRTLLNESLAKRIINVFICLNPEIVGMQTATFDGGQLTMRSYLETFPFQFYFCVDGGVERLPWLLADAIRQWFEMLSDI